MSTPKKIAIAFAVLLLIAALLLLFLDRSGSADLLNERSPEDYAGTGGGLNASPKLNANVGGVIDLEPEPPKPAAPPDYRASVKRLAAAFAERFGSFTNTGDFENVLDLKAFMTDSLAAWADGYVAEQRVKQGDATVYFAITTRAITVDLKSFDEEKGAAEAVVLTQRSQESGDAPGIETYYQDMTVRMIKDGDTWKIDFAKWGERRAGAAP